jgi:hypothetical protein
MTIQLVQGDTGPQLQFTITETTDGSAVDLTGATVTLHFRAKGTTTVLFSRTATILSPNAPLGIAILQFNNGDLNLTTGEYEGEVEVVLAGGLRQTIYEPLEFVLREDFA